MKIKITLLSLAVSVTAFANPDIDACLKAWGQHPFGKDPQYRILKVNVKILGIGGNPQDAEPTAKPDLVLVKHSFAVMSKQTLKLMNPNGWYCLKGPTSVLGKSDITVHCKAHVASSSDGAAIAGSNEDTGGVAVLGTIKITRACP